jgi:hypothetical protein
MRGLTFPAPPLMSLSSSSDIFPFMWIKVSFWGWAARMTISLVS